LGISDCPRYLLADSPRRRRRLVAPHGPSPGRDVSEPFRATLASESAVPERNDQDVLHVFLEKERCLLRTQSTRATIRKLTPPRFARLEDGSADAIAAGLDP
jgi:hypothetical protein